jgi:anaerobic selenocysteine-containing dehydrogenase
MSDQDAKHAPEGPPERRLSRRSLLQGAATAGAAGLAATAIGAAAGPALAATSRPPAADQAHDTAGTHAGPIMVHVRDARSGDIELFAGTSQTRVRDKDLAARITRAIG